MLQYCLSFAYFLVLCAILCELCELMLNIIFSFFLPVVAAFFVHSLIVGCELCTVAAYNYIAWLQSLNRFTCLVAKK